MDIHTENEMSIAPFRRAKSDVPLRLTDFPEYAAAEAKYRDIKERRRAVQAQITAATNALHVSIGGDEADVEARARDILAGGQGERRKESLRSMRENLGSLNEQLVVLQ